MARMSAAEAQFSARLAQDQQREVALAKGKAEERGDALVALNKQLRRSNYVADMNLARHAWDEGNLAPRWSIAGTSPAQAWRDGPAGL